MEEGTLKKSMLSPMDQQWALYVLLLSLINLWIALGIYLLSIEEPLHIVITDGSLIIFCVVSIWLTFAGFRQELMRGREGRPPGRRFRRESDDRRFWQYYDIYMVVAFIVTILGSTGYTVFLLGGQDVPDANRIVWSLAAGVIGALLSRRFIILTHEAGQSTATASPQLELETP
jgi:uncharacterized membrane protein